MGQHGDAYACLVMQHIAWLMHTQLDVVLARRMKIMLPLCETSKFHDIQG